MPRRASFTDSSLPWKERLKILLTGKATWLSIIYMILMLPIGIIYFTVMVTLVAVSVALIASPILAYVFNIPVGTYIDGDVIWHLPKYLTPLFAFVGIGLGTAYPARLPLGGQDPRQICQGAAGQRLKIADLTEDGRPVAATQPTG